MILISVMKHWFAIGLIFFQIPQFSENPWLYSKEMMEKTQMINDNISLLPNHLNQHKNSWWMFQLNRTNSLSNRSAETDNGRYSSPWLNSNFPTIHHQQHRVWTCRGEGWLMERPGAQMGLVHTSTDPSRFNFSRSGECIAASICVCVGGLLCLGLLHVWTFRYLPNT